MSRFIPILIGACALTSATPAFSTENLSPNETHTKALNDSFPRAFFDHYYPQTALDLIERVPGFTLEGGADLRGFGSGAGNVLVDSERPTIKSGGIEEFLSRIPADAVERIEVKRGAQSAGETAGQSLVVNIVRKPVKLSGTWSVELERAADGKVYPRGELSVAAQIKDWSTTTKVNAFWERFPYTTATRAQFDETGTLIRFQDETAPTTLTEAFIASEAKRPFAGGALTLNGRFGFSGFYGDTERFGFLGRLPDGGTPDDRLGINSDSEYIEGELSADWTRTVRDNWSLKLLSLASVRDLKQDTVTVSEKPLGTLKSTSLFTRDQTPIEVLMRATTSRISGKLRPEFGIEGAYNQLKSQLTLRVEDPTGSRFITLPASDVVIEEFRGEAFANLVWAAHPKTTIEAGLAGEASEISVTGDAANTQTFAFFKPSLAVNYTPTDGVQFRLSARRTVGQLNFSDFAASTNATDDRFLGGNPDLGPDQTTRVALTTDLRNQNGAAFNVELFHEWRDDVLEQIILKSGASGLANAGSARVWGLNAEASLPLGFVIPGGLLETTVALRDSTFSDPLTGATRNITGLKSPNVDINFRQDLPDLRFAWGVGYVLPTDIEEYFTGEASFSSQKSRWTMFVETTRFFGVKSQLELRNIGGQDLPRERQFFHPDRSGAFKGTERLDRTRGMFIKFTVASQF